MYNHAPAGYVCPFCRVVSGLDNPGWNEPSDVFWQTEHVTAFINGRWWLRTPAHALVIPNQHIENIYDLTPDLAIHVYEAARQVALAFKQVYGCDGVSTRQHNEPAGYQEVFHFHLHVFPRYHGDRLYEDHHAFRTTTADERKPYADRLRAYFGTVNG